MSSKKILAVLSGLFFLCVTQHAIHSQPKPGIADIGPIGPLGGSISGSVSAPKEFKAAQVFARNRELNVVYMAYTNAGHYEIVHLFPGTYEVTVRKNGFTCESSQVVTVRAGRGVSANLELVPGPHVPNELSHTEFPKGVKFGLYDEVYPPGPGRDVAENCLVCHGSDWLSTRQFDEAQWNSAIDDMARRGNIRVPGSFSVAERKILVDYLVRNFGPTSQPRRVAQPDVDVDENELKNAMYVEYRVPPLPKTGETARQSSQNIGDGDAPPPACSDCGTRLLHDPHIGNDGAIWYADQLGLTIGRLDPRTATVKDYVIPDSSARPHGLTMDAHGQVWFTNATSLGHLDPETEKMTFYRRDGIRSGGNTPIVDLNGDVWYTGGSSGSYIAKWDHATDKVTFYKTPSFEPQPYGMVHDSNNKIWFALLAQCKLVKFDPLSEQFVEYSPPVSDHPCTIRRLSFDHSGFLWYGLAGKVNGYQKIGRMDPATGSMVEYQMPYRFAWPYDIQPDPQNNMWVTDGGEGGNIVRFDVHSKKFIYYPMPQVTDMPKLEVTKEGAIWYTTRSGDPNIMSVGVLYPDKNKIRSFAAYNQ